MTKYPLSLGRSHPSGHLAQLSMGMQDKFYPGTHFEWDEDYELPEEGTITLRYRVTRDVVEKVPKEKNCVDVDFLEIVSVKGAKTEEDEYKSVGDSLDKLKAELESDSE